MPKRPHYSPRTTPLLVALRYSALGFAVLLGALLVGTGSSFAADTETPFAVPEISDLELFEKSLNAAEKALSFYGAWDAPEELERIAEIGYAVAQQTGFEAFPFSFYLIDMPEPNAFALPGGQIFMTRGMIQLGLDDDMLAGLLGHEIGHVVLHHGVRMEKRARLLNVLSQALLVGVVVASENNREDRGPVSVFDPTRSPSNRGDLVQGTAAAGLVLSELLLRSYSREFEDEADEEGLRLAAAAGYSPTGTARLMAKMQARLPESNDYGYWRTHPFFSDRVRAATAREEGIKMQPPSDTTHYRRGTQTVLLDHAAHGATGPTREETKREKGDKLEEESVEMLKLAGLTAWPRGARAEGLRRERLDAERSATLERAELARDYAALIASYRRELDLVAELTPGSDFLRELQREIETLDTQRSALYPRASEVFAGGVYETDFLRVFLSNFPDAEERAAAALAYGDANSRLRRPSEAVESYLEAQAADPDGEIGGRAARGLKALTPSLEDLSALQKLALEGDDELSALATERLADRVSRYETLANGAEYLRSHPESEHIEAVTARLHSIAEKLHGEMLLYQRVGDQVKALDRIQRILTDAPQSPAAERIRDSAVFES